jgi:hypothetical protein
VIEAAFIKQSFQPGPVAVLVGNRKIIIALARHTEPGLLKKTNDIGAVLNPSGFKFAAKRRVNGREQFFPVLAKFFGNLNRAATCGVIGTAQAPPFGRGLVYCANQKGRVGVAGKSPGRQPD